jgi:hypothetical protein
MHTHIESYIEWQFSTTSLATESRPHVVVMAHSVWAAHDGKLRAREEQSSRDGYAWLLGNALVSVADLELRASISRQRTNCQCKATVIGAFQLGVKAVRSREQEQDKSDPIWRWLFLGKVKNGTVAATTVI